MINKNNKFKYAFIADNNLISLRRLPDYFAFHPAGYLVFNVPGIYHGFSTSGERKNETNQNKPL